MTTNQGQRDATVTLTDPSNWIPWYRQLKLKCQPIGIWALVDLNGTTLPSAKPQIPLPPDITQYEPNTIDVNPPNASSSTARQGRGRGQTHEHIPDLSSASSRTVSAIIPTRMSELLEKGQEAYKNDCNDFNMHFKLHKIREKEYLKETNSLTKTYDHILRTVSPHLLLSCCVEGRTLRAWITALQDTVEVDEDKEKARARERYHHSLKPMRSTQNWEAWLGEYNQAATRA
ncbi:hypothetical protein P3342_004762 [Pyrenophora teres f. teres]|uniref:Uncharacterized protein n=1 Tax=Pyrenophora teres f. teres (strain 0-1) TaxID=861557 RepID=E3RGV3_PYRTT|nr:hypothetical protein PTT_07060 [Pyrenophora teres f. teres 0-1]KAE8846509.1 hypothetical protein HRS9139_01076 [Pyrenophora teres f. teres]CAA9959562.1 hypothetical protein PTMSG1_02979 [Pyrenophora teres f. maculata]KAE8848652.1 hypothetical protein PTNB85_02495 [Pyrenophora teres f. teres]KAE8868579.1 hypothetical protein PTNB29_02490 [Pyrenophora teres f. teres]